MTERVDFLAGGNLMSLSLRERKAAVREVSKRYQKASRKEKGKILDEFVKLTGYTRCYSSYVLRSFGKKIKININGKNIILLADNRIKQRRRNNRKYDESVLKALKYLWRLSDYLCGKRVAEYIKETLPVLERFDEIKLDENTRNKLMSISPATIDRLLKKERDKCRLKNRGRSLTKPGTLLKHQIPIRTFADWNEKKPGFVEVDLVGHDGGILRGDFLYTLDATDVHTGWTETRAVRNKAQVWVFDALTHIRRRLPFNLLGIDSDNGSEFINGHLMRYCEREKITFTRSRPYRKNDNCFVEQKNYSVVRRAVGYLRYDTEKELKTINRLYAILRLYTNFFQPSMKLIEKTRTGSKVTKKYSKPATPYQRIIQSNDISESVKASIMKEYEQLNPAALKREIDNIQRRLWRQYSDKKRGEHTAVKPNDFVYNLNEATI